MEKKELDAVRKINDFKITGVIKATKDLESKTSKAGEEYLSGSITIETCVDGQTSLFDVEVYQKKLTKDGKPSVLFDTYLGLANKIGQKYTVNGSITENRFFDKKTSTLASAYKLAGKWFNPAKVGEADSASFTFSGFVNKPLTERKSKKDDGSIICYDIEIGQASYNDDKCAIYKFQIDPTNANVYNGIANNWQVGSTVKFSGKLSCIVEQKTVEEKSGFGESVVKTFINTTKRFWITGGDMPIMDGKQYSLADVQRLKSVYAQKDLELQAAANSGVQAGMMDAGMSAGVTSRQTSLI